MFQPNLVIIDGQARSRQRGIPITTGGFSIQVWLVVISLIVVTPFVIAVQEARRVLEILFLFYTEFIS